MDWETVLRIFLWTFPENTYTNTLWLKFILGCLRTIFLIVEWLIVPYCCSSKWDIFFTRKGDAMNLQPHVLHRTACSYLYSINEHCSYSNIQHYHRILSESFLALVCRIPKQFPLPSIPYTVYLYLLIQCTGHGSNSILTVTSRMQVNWIANKVTAHGSACHAVLIFVKKRKH